MKKILLLVTVLMSINSAHAFLMDDLEVESAGQLVTSTTSLPTALILSDGEELDQEQVLEDAIVEYENGNIGDNTQALSELQGLTLEETQELLEVLSQD